VTNWSAFFGLLNHVHNTLSPPFHTPILLIAQPTWTTQDHETLTQFFFEKFKTPAFCIMDSALSICYAYGITSATVVDVGFEKVDVTAVSDYIACDVGRGVAIADCGGESMTKRLLELLAPRGWTREMCEQLKKSNICEILPTGTPLPGASESSAIASASTASAPLGRIMAGAQGEAPRGPGQGTDAGEEDGTNGEKENEDNDGVLDVASIVASGKTQEFLAKKEREKAEKASKKSGADTAAPPKPSRLPNSKRDKNHFFYEEYRLPQDTGEEPVKKAGESEATDEKQKIPEASYTQQPAEEKKASDGTAPPATEEVVPAETGATRREQAKAARREERRRNRQNALENSNLIRREVEVGKERFLAASGGTLEAIADAVHRTIMSVEPVGKRGELWDSLIIVGNGSRVRGMYSSSSF
jgi:actin-related protein 9